MYDALKYLPRAFFACLLMLSATLSPTLAQSMIRDAEIEDTLRLYGEPLFIAGGLNPDDVDIYIIQDNSLNAFVYGGQNIFFHTELLLEAESASEIIGVMAHETGHITGAHNARSTDAIRTATSASWVALGLGVLAIAAGAPDAGVAIMAGSQQVGVLNYFAYSRAQESAADQAALYLLEKTNMPADGLVSFMDKIRDLEIMSASASNPYWRTHPEVGPRVSALRTKADRLTATAPPLPEEYEIRLQMMQAKLMGFLYPRKAYYKYPDADTSLAAYYARAIAAHKMNDPTRALSQINTAIELAPDNAYLYELKGQILFESGKFLESIEPNRKSVELAPDKALLYVNLARSLIAKNDRESNEEAEHLLYEALLFEPGNAFTYQQLSFALGALGRKAEAELATAEAAYGVGDLTKAHLFARRAMDGLEPNTPKWVRADDIAASTDPRVIGLNGPSRRVAPELSVRANVTR